MLELLNEDDIGCIDGHFPIQKTIIACELGIFALWIVATPVFLACSKMLGYQSKEEVQVHKGLRKEILEQDSAHKLDFLDYSKSDLSLFNTSLVNFLMTIAVFIAVPAATLGSA